MENILSPSILSADFGNLERELAAIEAGGAKYVHIDVMDGMFVPSISFGMPVIRSVRKYSPLIFDVHLMIEEPIRYLKDFADAGADIITVHYEACKDIRATLKEIKALGIRPALSIKPLTDVNVVRDYMDDLDMILLMSVEPGFGGQKFIESSLQRAADLRHIIDDQNAKVDLEIDGGIKLDNVSKVLDAGVNIIVAGSAIFSDTQNNTCKFMDILKR